MNKTQKISLMIYPIAALALLVLATIFVNVPVADATHGLTRLQCEQQYPPGADYLESTLIVCRQHADVDEERAYCTDAGEPGFDVSECLKKITPAPDGYGTYVVPATPEAPGEPLEDKLTCADGVEGIALSEGKCLPFEADNPDTKLSQNPIIQYLGILIRFTMVGVGVIVTLVIVIAGIRYTAAKGNPQETAAAKDMILKAIIGLLMYLFSGAAINYLIPGAFL